MHKSGVAGLYKIHFARDLKFLKKGLKLPKHLKAAADLFGGPANVEQQMLDRVINDLFCKNIRARELFYAHAAKISPILISHGQKLLGFCLPVLKAYHNLHQELEKLKRANLDNRTIYTIWIG